MPQGLDQGQGGIQTSQYLADQLAVLGCVEREALRLPHGVVAAGRQWHSLAYIWDLGCGGLPHIGRGTVQLHVSGSQIFGRLQTSSKGCGGAPPQPVSGLHVTARRSLPWLHDKGSKVDIGFAIGQLTDSTQPWQAQALRVGRQDFGDV